MFSFALDTTVVWGMSCEKHKLPLNPDLQTLLDCSAQPRTISELSSWLCPVWDRECTQRGCPPLCAMTNCLLRELQNNVKQLRLGIFPLEQHVLKQ